VLADCAPNNKGNKTKIIDMLLYLAIYGVDALFNYITPNRLRN
jgi:hypothetical protein